MFNKTKKTEMPLVTEIRPRPNKQQHHSTGNAEPPAEMIDPSMNTRHTPLGPRPTAHGRALPSVHAAERALV